MNNKFFAFIVGIPLILFVVIGGYFFWDVNRPIEPNKTVPTVSTEIVNTPSENVKNTAPKNVPLWTEPGIENASESTLEQKPSTQPNPTPSIKNPTTQPSPISSPKSPPVSISSLIIPTQNGNVSVKDFYKNPQTQVFEQGGRYEYAILSESSIYGIVYHKAENSFDISLDRNPLGIARQAAEKDFLEKLAITENQACQLSVSVGVPISVNEDAAGVDYYLSFCPNGIPLP